MKKILTIMCMALTFGTTLSAQQLEKLFDKYMEDERFNYVYQKRANMMDRLADMGNMEGLSMEKSLESSGRQMLTLNSTDIVLDENFTKEVENALKSDKYEQVSIVRNGKNRVETYEKRNDKEITKVSFIKNPGNIIITLNRYALRNK